MSDAGANTAYASPVFNYTADQWAHLCRVQAALTTDATTRSFLLELAADYDDIAIQEAKAILSKVTGDLHGTMSGEGRANDS